MRASNWVWLGAVVLVCGVVVAERVLFDDEDTRGPSRPTTQVGITVELDEDSYAPARPVTATVTVTNNGFVPAEGLVVDCDPDPEPGRTLITTSLARTEDQIPLDTGELDDLPALAPGASHTATATGVVSPAAQDVGVVAVVCEVSAPNASGTVVTQDTAAATGVSNEVTGRFTLCRDDNDDAGAPGMTLTLERGLVGDETPPPPLSAVTDADGHFAFPAVPAGPYYLSFAPPAGHTFIVPDLGTQLELLVTSDEVRWQASRLAVTPKDPATTCA
jgi:hypothetical protein